METPVFLGSNPSQYGKHRACCTPALAPEQTLKGLSVACPSAQEVALTCLLSFGGPGVEELGHTWPCLGDSMPGLQMGLLRPFSPLSSPARAPPFPACLELQSSGEGKDSGCGPRPWTFAHLQCFCFHDNKPAFGMHWWTSPDGRLSQERPYTGTQWPWGWGEGSLS